MGRALPSSQHSSLPRTLSPSSHLPHPHTGAVSRAWAAHCLLPQPRPPLTFIPIHPPFPNLPNHPHRSGFEGMGRAELRAWCQGQIARYKARLAGCRPGWFAGSGGRLPRLIAGAAVVGFLVCNSAVCCRLRAAATCCHPCTTHGPADPTVLEVCGQLPHDCLRQAPGAAPALSQRWNEHASAKCCTCFLWLSSAEAI